jgi:hypothetical protein
MGESILQWSELVPLHFKSLNAKEIEANEQNEKHQHHKKSDRPSHSYAPNEIGQIDAVTTRNVKPPRVQEQETWEKFLQTKGKYAYCFKSSIPRLDSARSCDFSSEKQASREIDSKPPGESHVERRCRGFLLRDFRFAGHDRSYVGLGGRTRGFSRNGATGATGDRLN